MENYLIADVATCEVSRAQLWIWLKYKVKLDDEREINEDLIDEADIDNIVADIKEKGLSRPVIVSLKDGEYSLMLGTKRILAAKKVNSSSIFCGVIDGIVDKSEVAAIALCYTSLEDMLNDEDKILAINYLYKNFKGDLNKISSITCLLYTSPSPRDRG